MEPQHDYLTLQHNDNKAVEVETRVIKKLFRRLITFLFVLFVFSFLIELSASPV